MIFKKKFIILLIFFIVFTIFFAIRLASSEKKEFIIRVDVEPLFCINDTCYWPEQGTNYPYNIMKKCLINKKTPDWSCKNNFYSEKGFLDGLINVMKTAKNENIKISICLMGDTVKWMNDHREYIISTTIPEYSIKQNGEYKVDDLIRDIEYYWNEDLIEVGMHATRSEDLSYEMNERCGKNYTCAEEYFDWLIKTNIEDFEETFEKRPDYWQKHLGLGTIENISSNYSCIYVSVLEKNEIPIFGAHFIFTNESSGGANSQVVEFENYSIKEISLGEISEPIQSRFPHFTTTWDQKAYIVTTHSWNFYEMPGKYNPCPDCKFANESIFKDYTPELIEFIHKVKNNGDTFINYKDLSRKKSTISSLVC